MIWRNITVLIPRRHWFTLSRDHHAGWRRQDNLPNTWLLQLHGSPTPRMRCHHRSAAFIKTQFYWIDQVQVHSPPLRSPHGLPHQKLSQFEGSKDSWLRGGALVLKSELKISPSPSPARVPKPRAHRNGLLAESMATCLELLHSCESESNSRSKPSRRLHTGN